MFVRCCRCRCVLVFVSAVEVSCYYCVFISLYDSFYIKSLIKLENNKNWENKCNQLELTENIHESWKHLKQIMGTNHTKLTYPTLVINENNIKTKITTTEQKVITLTKTLEKIFTQDQNKQQFSKSHKVEVNHHIETNNKIYKPLKQYPSTINLTKTASQKQK